MAWQEHPKNWVSASSLSRVALVVHDGDRSHVVRHDPARVLREIDAKRRLLAEYQRADAEGKYPDWPGGYASGLEYAVQIAAAEYADRPGYDPEWAPRSQWGPPAE
jgi:hypothetical protein